MKKWTRFAALVLALALLASLLPTLSVPAEATDTLNFTFTDGVLSWQALDGADHYIIFWETDGWFNSSFWFSEYFVTATSYNLQAAMDADSSAYSGEYTINVRAYRSDDSCLQSENIHFDYHSSLPELEPPVVWFNGTSFGWQPLEHATEYYVYELYTGSTPTAMSQSSVNGVLFQNEEKLIDFSDIVEPDLYYTAFVEARPTQDSGYKRSRQGQSRMVLGADLLAGYSDKPQPLSGSARIGLFHYQGSTVSVSMRGDASHIPAEELRYQWQRKSGDSWANIPGATQNPYRVQAADVTAGAIRVVVKGNEEHGYSGYLISNSCLIVDSIPVIEDYFPDPYFRQYLDDKFNTDGNYVLDAAEIRKITTLSLNVYGENYSNVASLEGLKYLPYVENIYANHTKITSFDGSDAPDLAVLELSECPLESLNLRENACMRQLYLSNLTSNLRNPDLSGMPELCVLETYGCNISVMDISKNPYLVQAALYGTVTDAAYSSRIYELSSGNYLRTDGYDSNVTLAHFSEAVPDATLRSVLMIQTFNWDQNDELTIAEAKAITDLYVSEYGEQLTSLKGVELLPNLGYLSAFDNDLQYVNLSRNTKLWYLDLGQNRLRRLDLSKNTALEQFYCCKNELTELKLGSNAALAYVDADENQLTQLDLSGLPALETLRVCHNQLTGLKLSANSELKSLYCNCNEITKLNIAACPKLISAYRGTRTEGVEDGVSFLSYKDANDNRLLIDASVTVETDKPINPFVDVAESDWFYKPVMWAVKNNITSGVGDGKFGPGNTCTRAQIVTFLWAAEGRP